MQTGLGIPVAPTTIQGTRQGAAESGYQPLLTSATITDPAEAAALATGGA